MGKFRVTFKSIVVHRSDDGAFDSTLETKWNFIINGSIFSWTKNLKAQNTPYAIDISHDLDVPDNSIIHIEVYGNEIDTVSDDELPGFIHTWNIDNHWGLGFHPVKESNDDIAYTLNYEISQI
ncbi:MULTISPECIES: hypothetical protein [Brevibacillus]|uniref:hypothetical protein n=1 Tax=Brevibacillus TaxID=55080 RepID=UPI00156BA9D0|nr:hypothetical protein [Brevibacillus sp. RS1.1]NRR00703.1 hypothetical protein [Brevibacillus sp. RS1.1]